MKKWLTMLLSALIAVQTMAFGVFAAETKTELYNEDFNDFNTAKVQDVGVVKTEGTATIRKTMEKDTADENNKKLSLQQNDSSNPAGRLDFENSLEIKSTGKKQIAEVEFDAQVINCDNITTSSSKTVTSDYLLSAPEADATGGYFGGIRFEVKITSTAYGETMPNWNVKFVAADGSVSSTLKTISNADMKANPPHFKVQYVFREDGQVLNAARVWIDGERVGDDLDLKPGDSLTSVAGILIKPSGKDKAPKAVIDNLVVSEIFDDGAGTEGPVDPTPTPDPEYPVPEGDDAEPDLALKTGTLAAFNFDKFDKTDDSALPVGWYTGKQAKYIVPTDGKNGRALRLNGTASSETNMRVLFAETGLNKDTAPPEGKSIRVATEFDMRLNNIQAKADNATQTVDLQFGKDVNDEGGSSNTPGIQITFDKDSFTYKTNGNNSNPVSYQQGEWIHFKVTHLVTDSHGNASKNFRLEINGEEIINSTKLSSATDSKIAKYNQFLIRLKNAGANTSIDIDNFVVEKFALSNLQVSDPMFYQGDTDTPMTDLNDADILRTKINFKVGEDEPEVSSAVVITALYEMSGQTPVLLQAATGRADLTAGAESSAEVNLNLSEFTAAQRNTMGVTVFVWDGAGGMQPLVPCKAMK